ncbi:MAG: FRG domain-containing protein [Anaerosomatales bacterium]|nr:FRG domain-containing protein [Anaerosomatales bacterium]
MDVSAFWSPWEVVVDSFDAVEAQVYGVFEKWSKRGSVFAWRGQMDASWPLHSSLYRRLLWSSSAAEAPKESDVANAEREILADVRRWGLHMGEYGRLSVMNQMAMLQHYGAPTRLIDITFNPWIGLWFAVQERRADEDGTPRDARLFAFDVTHRLINGRESQLRDWEDSLTIPWPRPVAPTASPEEREAYRQWITNTYAWRPPRFHPRLAAQNGGFLLGGVPSTGAMTWPKTSDPADGVWTIDEVRRATSVAMRVQKVGADPDDPGFDVMYTLRISASAVPTIRRRLQELFGYEPLTMYPDYPGFADYGTPRLRRTPPA